MDLNVELIEKVKAAIRREAKAFDMSYWLDGNYEAILEKTPLEKCNSTACIAGWTILLGANEDQTERFIVTVEDTNDDWSTGETEHINITDLARNLLGHSCSGLFFLQSWPKDLRNEYRRAEREGDKQKAAEVACQVLDNLIESGGESLESQY